MWGRWRHFPDRAHLGRIEPDGIKSSLPVRPTDAYISRAFDTLNLDTEVGTRLAPQAPN